MKKEKISIWRIIIASYLLIALGLSPIAIYAAPPGGGEGCPYYPYDCEECINHLAHGWCDENRICDVHNCYYGGEDCTKVKLCRGHYLSESGCVYTCKWYNACPCDELGGGGFCPQTITNNCYSPPQH